jgi:hypothetical protein
LFSFVTVLNGGDNRMTLVSRFTGV